MSSKNAITAYKPDPVMMPTQGEWSLMMDMATSLVPTGFLPETIKNPQQAVAIMLKGRELGVPPMYALSNIVIVKGKPTVSAEMMLALIYRDHGKRAIRVKASDDTQCTVEYRLDGWSDVSSYVFSMEQAKTAGLTTNPTWNKYPAAMLRARCISAVARMAFPESIAGMYVPGELGEPTDVTDDGEVISISTATVVDLTTGEIEADDNTTAMRRIHAVGKEYGISHEALHAWAESKGHQSLRDVPSTDLNALSDVFGSQPNLGEKFIAKYQPIKTGPITNAEAEAIEASGTAQPELVTAAVGATQDRFRGDGA